MALIDNKDYSLCEVINHLKAKGYTEDFNLQHACKEFESDPTQFVIEETYRFDNQSDPDDQCVLYAIHCKKRNIKGILLNGFGIYNDTGTTKLVNKMDTDYQDQLF